MPTKQRSVVFHADFMQDPERTISGYEGGVCPIDKVAELVLSSSCYRIGSVTITYPEDITPPMSITYTVKKVIQ